MTPPRPGFQAGIGSLFGGVGFLFRAHRTWPYAAVPALILGVLAAGSVVLSVAWLRPAIETWLGPSDAWYAELGSAITAWLAAVLASLVGLLLALAITPPLSGPALEKIVLSREAALGAPARRPLGFFAEMWFGLKAQVFAAFLAVPLLLLLALIELLFPPAIVVTLPAKLLVASLAVAWNLFDYPLTLRGVGMRERLSVLRANKAAALGFGAAFAVLFWIPCFQVLMLPVGVAAATALIWKILAADPSLLPSLPRPQAPTQAEVSSDPPQCRSDGAA